MGLTWRAPASAATEISRRLADKSILIVTPVQLQLPDLGSEIGLLVENHQRRERILKRPGAVPAVPVW